MAGTVSPPAGPVVGRRGEIGLVRWHRCGADFLPEEEGELVAAQEGAASARRYGAVVASRRYVHIAVSLAVAGELEILFRPPDGDALVTAFAMAALALPVAWSRRAPVAVLALVAAVLLAQAVAGGSLVGQAITVIVLAVALYAAGRHASGTWQLAGAAGAATILAATRITYDPAAQQVGEAVITFLAVATPLLVGRWSRGQTLLQRELADKARRRARDRDSYARQAADEERARIAVDLQVAVAGGLRTILDDAQALDDQLEARAAVDAGDRLAGIAATARAALADVRRVLGVLRHERRLSPPRAVALPAAEVARHGSTPASALRGCDVTRAASAEPARAARHLDALLAAAVFAGAATELVVVAPDGQLVIAPLTAVGVAVPLLWRRSRPLWAAFAVLLAVGVQSAFLDLEAFPTSDIAAIVCAVYAVGAYAADRAAAAGVVLFGAADAAHAAVFYPDGVVAALLGGVAVPWTVGRVVRGNRQLTRESRQKQAEVELSREREARAAITDERMRVARELHDAVAHNISVIAIQAAGAEGLVHRDPERARRCLALIIAVAREALTELGRLAELPVDGGAAAAPSLTRVDRLADRARAAGLAVTLRVDGEPPALSVGVELAAYRIVQEALANTAKHAHADRAWVTVSYTPRAVELEIADDGRGPTGDSRARHRDGHGLVGMRERVALYRGSLDVGPGSGGGYRVQARLPVDA